MRRWWLLAAAAAGQYLDLEGSDVPSAHALATIARFFIWAPNAATRHGTSDSTAPMVVATEEDSLSRFAPSPGWGFWDSKSSREAKILAKDVSYHFGGNTKKWRERTQEAVQNQTEAEVHQIDQSYLHHSSPGQYNLYLDLAIMEYNDFWNVFVPHQKTHHFCCTKADIARGTCEGPGFLVPSSIRDRTFVSQIPISRAYNTVIDAETDIDKSGIYYAVLVNCGQSLEGGTFSGSIVAKGTYGYLSGVDTPKLQLYFWGSLACLALSVVWVAWCIRYRRQIILLHTYVGLVIAVSFVEQILFYIQLSWSNAMSQPSMVLKFMALSASVAKNVLTAGLVLVTCLGLNITRPSLETQTKVKVVASIIILALLDAERQIATHFHISYDFSIALMLLCALPITILYTVGFMWCFRSLTVLLEELRSRRQTAKLRQMTRYRAVLIVAAILFVSATVVESYVLSMDIQQIWFHEWIFTDALPVFLYMFVLVLTALIWRPHRSSKYYSYNVQLGDEEDDIEKGQGEITWNSPHGTELEIRTWGDVELEEEEASAETFKPFEGAAKA